MTLSRPNACSRISLGLFSLLELSEDFPWPGISIQWKRWACPLSSLEQVQVPGTATILKVA